MALPQLTAADQTFELTVPAGSALPTLSMLRDFTAPVVAVVAGQTPADLQLLMSADSDSFNRWSAGQSVATNAVLAIAAADPAAEAATAAFIAGAKATLLDGSLGAFMAPVPHCRQVFTCRTGWRVSDKCSHVFTGDALQTSLSEVCSLV